MLDTPFAVGQRQRASSSNLANKRDQPELLGANVGTTLIVQVLSFNVSAVAPVFFIVGVITFRAGGQSLTRALGRIAIGLGHLAGVTYTDRHAGTGRAGAASARAVCFGNARPRPVHRPGRDHDARQP